MKFALFIVALLAASALAEPPKPCNNVLQTVRKSLDDKDLQKELARNYSDPVVCTLRKGIEYLHSTTSMTHLKGIAHDKFVTVLDNMATAFGVQDFLKPFHGIDQVRKSFSHEVLTELADGSHRFFWVMGQHQNNTSDMVNGTITHELFVLATQITLNLTGNKTEMKVMRTSVPLENNFGFSRFDDLKSPWPLNTTHVVMDMLRYMASSVLVQQAPPALLIKPAPDNPLADFHFRRVNSRADVEANLKAAYGIEAGLDDKSNFLGLAVKGFVAGWNAFVDVFKTKITVTTKSIVRLGFDYYHQQSSIFHAAAVAKDKIPGFFDIIIPMYDLPADPQTRLITLEVDFVPNVTWDKDDYLYGMQNGTDKAFLLFKSGDLATNLADFYFVDISANFDLTPDLLVIRTQTSILGGLFGSDKTEIQEVPHELTLDETDLLQQFFRIIAIGKLADTLGVSYTYPELPPTLFED